MRVNASAADSKRNFLKRNKICFKSISGESASVNPADVSNFTDEVPNLIRNYELRDVYNADETGLFFRALPSVGAYSRADT